MFDRRGEPGGDVGADDPSIRGHRGVDEALVVGGVAGHAGGPYRANPVSRSFGVSTPNHDLPSSSQARQRSSSPSAPGMRSSTRCSPPPSLATPAAMSAIVPG